MSTVGKSFLMIKGVGQGEVNGVKDEDLAR